MSYIYINTTNYYSAVKGGCDVRSTAQAVVTGTLSVAERSYPTSKVRGRGREDPMPEGRRPRGVTPRPRSGAAAQSARLRRRRNGSEELPHVRSRGWGGGQEEIPHALKPEARGGGQEELPHTPTPEARGGSREEQPHVRGQGGSREEIPSVLGQGRWGEELPRVRGRRQQPRVPDCDSAGTAERSYPTSEVREGGWEEIPHAPMPEARGSCQEDQPHAMAAQAQEGLEDLSHVEGQEGRWWGDTPRPR